MNTIPGLTFDEDLHEYRMLGKRVPSVTEILSPLSSFGMVNQADLEYASERGRAAHAACSLALTGDLDESSVDPAVAPYLEAFRLFLRTSAFQPHLSERVVYHQTKRYAGTFDLMGYFSRKGEPTGAIIDIKTAQASSPTWGLQLAGYVDAFNSEKPRGKVKERWTLQLSGDATFKLTAYTNPADFVVFDSFHSIFKWRQSR